MIGIKKLSGLRTGTRLRKIASILHEYELALRAGAEVDLPFLAQIGGILQEEEWLSPRARAALSPLPSQAERAEILRACNLVRNALLTHLGAGPADWDFLAPQPGGAEPGSRTTFPISLYLDDLRSPFNVGSIFRSAEAFGVETILLSDVTPQPDHPRARRASMGAADLVPWIVASPPALEREESLFALETGGTPLESFPFPAKGVLIVGSEELGVGPELLALADRRLGRVSIPLFGAKRSLNVGHAVSIVLYWWGRTLRNATA